MKKTALTIIILTLIAVSCKDIHVQTLLNSDGSLVRNYEITISNNQTDEIIKDKQELENEASQEKDIPLLPRDTTWDKKVSKDSTSNKITQHYSKAFINAEKLQKTYKTHDYLFKISHPKVTFTNQFNGFKSSYEYKEHFDGIFPCQNPMEIFTKDEFEAIRTGIYQENKQLEDKYDLWIAYGFIHLIKQTVDSVSKGNITLERWETEIKLTINEIIYDSNKDTTKHNENRSDFSNLDFLIKTIEASIGKKIDESTKVVLEKTIESHVELYTTLLINDLTFSISFPGKLSSTNADSIAGNTAYWKVSPLIAGTAFNMELESGTMNFNIFILFLIAFIIILLFRKWRN